MRNKAGLILLNLKGEVLIEHPTNHSPNIWSIPKGVVNKGENEYDAAIRETTEETSIDIRKIKHELIKEIPLIKYHSNRNKIKMFVIQLKEDISELELSCPSMVTQMRGETLIKPFPEVDEYRWVSLEESCKLIHEAQSRGIREYLLG